MKKFRNLSASQRRSQIYYAASFVIVTILAILFAFPLYWILTGAFKPGADINNVKETVWWPSEFVMNNFDKLLDKRSAPLFELVFKEKQVEIGNLVFTFGKNMTIMYYIYYNAFKLYRYGYGRAMGVILAIIIAILSAIQFTAGQEK